MLLCLLQCNSRPTSLGNCLSSGSSPSAQIALISGPHSWVDAFAPIAFCVAFLRLRFHFFLTDGQILKSSSHEYVDSFAWHICNCHPRGGHDWQRLWSPALRLRLCPADSTRRKLLHVRLLQCNTSNLTKESTYSKAASSKLIYMYMAYNHMITSASNDSLGVAMLLTKLQMVVAAWFTRILAAIFAWAKSGLELESKY